MSAPLPRCPPRTVANAVDDIIFAELEELADRAASYWRSIGEAAYRRERITIAVHLRQVRLLTFAMVQTVEALGTESTEETPG